MLFVLLMHIHNFYNLAVPPGLYFSAIVEFSAEFRLEHSSMEMRGIAHGIVRKNHERVDFL